MKRMLHLLWRSAMVRDDDSYVVSVQYRTSLGAASIHSSMIAVSAESCKCDMACLASVMLQLVGPEPSRDLGPS